MKKKLKIIGLILLLIIIGLSIYVNVPVDIRPQYVKNGDAKVLEKKGFELMKEMEVAYGGRLNWDSIHYAEFIQVADWYGRLKISRWDTLPQRFKMKSYPNSDNCEFEFLNGKNTGRKYKNKDNKIYEYEMKDIWNPSDNHGLLEKMIFKNYWFQFPFRINEASIIRYAGKEKIGGVNYDLIYATWGKEKANREFDQFVLYINEGNKRIDYLHFTVREKLKAVSINCAFRDFREIGDFHLPYSQFVRYGKPGEEGTKFHENHYEKMILHSNKKDSRNEG